MIKDSVRYNGLTSLGITKLDVLTGLERVRLCVGYELEGRRTEIRPASLKMLSRCEPIYEDLPGWKEDISGVRVLDQLPGATRHYLKRIEEITQVPLSFVSVGPARQETIDLMDPF
jgi:adenylosuccinate synthase